MAKRKPDLIRVETASGYFDAFESIEITNDIQGIAEAKFVCGDDASFAKLEQLVAPGQPFKVFCNNHLRLTGRAEVNEVPGDSSSGVALNLTVRTRMADAKYSSADKAIKIEGKSLRQLIVAAYAPIRIKEANFVFGEFVDVDAMTGQGSKGRAAFEPDPIQLSKAKVQPPETIYEFVERHLKRYRATHWDAPGGQIMVGRPDVKQPCTYKLQCRRGAASAGNNLISYNRAKDWTDVPHKVEVHGKSQGEDSDTTSFRATAIDADVAKVANAAAGHFNRIVTLQDQQCKSLDTATQTANRELANRIQRKDCWDFVTDGWSYWDGTQQIDWAPNAMADVDVDQVGGAQGSYLITKTILKLAIGAGATTAITAIIPLAWSL